ncbi:hypothetical protein [Polaromonas sp.]|uniref:hypothetical protein n=1 Tax=Polaromonas sp. TaxID=1869339 RepID=UPI0017FE87CF|nr:hypothetical protein [Polaromonas sp.]NMM04987.1 hypothetical protein [Polaromonas sp.]
MSGISKHFGALVANDDISLQLQAGEVLAPLGERPANRPWCPSCLGNTGGSGASARHEIQTKKACSPIRTGASSYLFYSKRHVFYKGCEAFAMTELLDILANPQFWSAVLRIAPPLLLGGVCLVAPRQGAAGRPSLCFF